MDYFKSDEFTETVSNLGSKFSEKAALVQLYPLFKQATSSREEPTPGYIYEVLVQFTFESQQSAHLLVDYLNRRLQRHSAPGIRKTLKCVRQLVERGSRAFRAQLRANDEHVKRAPDFGSQRDTLTGTATLVEIRSLSAEILVALFEPAAVARDASSVPEVPPQFSTKLAGMGSGGGVSGGGRYEGFGSSPHHRSPGLTDKVRDMIESVLSSPDPKQQVLELCLKDSKGSYEPAAVDVDLTGAWEGPNLAKKAVPRVEKPQHIPGRAGGGWEEDNEEEEDLESEDDAIADFGDLSLETDREVAEEDVVTTSKEHQLISEFCRQPGGLPVKYEELLKVAEDLATLVSNNSSSESQTAVLGSLRKTLGEEEAETTVLRCLLVLEKILEEGIISINSLYSLRKILERLKSSESQQVSMKAAKILAILEHLRSSKTA